MTCVSFLFYRILFSVFYACVRDTQTQRDGDRQGEYKGARMGTHGHTDTGTHTHTNAKRGKD
jgi:hypothetical protein